MLSILFKRKKILIGFLIITGALSLYMFATKDNSSNNKDTIRIATMGEPGSLDPQYTSGSWERIIMDDLFAGLVERDAQGGIRLSLADSYKVSNDGLVHTFYLKKDLKWSDGTPLNAEDFVYSYRRMLNPNSATSEASMLYIIKGAKEYNADETKVNNLAVRALESNVLEITLDYPAPYFLSLLVHYTYYPVPKHTIEKFAKEWTKPGNMVSNGAYKMVDRRVQNYVKAVKNDLFWDAGNTKINNVVYYTQEDRSTILKRFRANEIEWANDFASDQYEWLKENMKDEAIVSPALGIYFYTVHTASQKNPGLRDVRVRQALAMAVDRQFIVDKVVKTGEMPAYSFVPQGTAGYDIITFPWKDLSETDRLNKAKELLKEAGFDENNPLKLELSYSTSENHKKIVIALSDMWKKIGIESTNSNADTAVHFKNLQQGDYQIGRGGWYADFNDPATFLYLGQTGTSTNYSHYSNKEFDDLVYKAQRTIDNNERKKYYQQAEAIILRDLPYIPLYYYAYRNLVSKRISGWHTNLDGQHQTRFISFK